MDKEPLSLMFRGKDNHPEPSRPEEEWVGQDVRSQLALWLIFIGPFVEVLHTVLASVEILS